MVARWLNRARRRAVLAVVCAASLAGAPSLVAAQERSITMASTTSTEQSGLFAHLLPAFKQATGIDVRVVDAIVMLRSCAVTSVWVHASDAAQAIPITARRRACFIHRATMTTLP